MLWSSGASSPAASLHKPVIEELLRAVGLDVIFHRAQGDCVHYYDDRGDERKVIDFVGGYGTLLLGHNHPVLLEEACRFWRSYRPNHVQGSVRGGAQQLAHALSERLGKPYYCVLANSGCEAVEAAIKHASLETKATTWIALEGGFHGKTKGALELTANPAFRDPFAIDATHVIRVEPGNRAQLHHAFQTHRSLAGFIYEPIQGEGGMRPVDREFLQLAAALCLERKIPIVADECQTGLGRTGTFLASEQLGVSPDYIILSKALGGGLAKISALLIEQKRYQRDFELAHSSTFADDEFSCAIALKVLQLLDERALASATTAGHSLLQKLEPLRQRYPELIADVRGVGLMIGLQLQRHFRDAGLLWRHLQDRGLLGPLLASDLFHRNGIRVAPALSDSMTLRIQPSLLITQSHIDQLVHALDDLCDRLSQGGVYELTHHLPVPRKHTPLADIPRSSATRLYYFASGPHAQPSRLGSHPSTTRIAWIFHLPDASQLDQFDPELACLTPKQRQVFLRRWSPLSEPIVMPLVHVQSLTGAWVEMIPILLPLTSRWMIQHGRLGERNDALKLVERAVDVAGQLACDVVTLGQFTSIVSQQGRMLDHRHMLVTSGSNYTAALVIEVVQRALGDQALDPAELELAVVGATGDIARTIATALAPRFRTTTLIGSGRRNSATRLQQIRRTIPRATVATNLLELKRARVVICGTNCAPFIGPEWLHPSSILCDVSVPHALRLEVARNLPYARLLPGGIATLPHQEEMTIPGFPLPPGHIYGCMAEGLLLALDNHRYSESCARWTGRSSVDRAAEIATIAACHGFRPTYTLPPSLDDRGGI
jgi:acetylornithine/succinyldiaminopimelate/putrescine aminotransferase/predicted amino acid dehydrogenase